MGRRGTWRRWVWLLCALGLSACDAEKPSDDDATSEKRSRRRKKRKKRAKTRKRRSGLEPTATVSAAPLPKPPPPTPTASPTPGHPGLLDPALANMRAPADFTVRYDTTKGPITFVCHRKWAPHGADRIYSLVKIGFFRDVALYRVAAGFVVQWGIHGDPAVNAAWKAATLPVDPVVATNKRGTISFAMAGSPTTRTTQLFVNTGDNRRLDGLGFAPVCEIERGMAVVDGLFSGHGEKVTRKQAQIMAEGNPYLRREWPGLDYIVSAAVLGSP